MTTEPLSRLLPDDLLDRCRARAPRADAANEFFSEDLSELQATQYLAAVVPESMGGSGLGLTALVEAQRRLAAAAPATALGVNMHLVWVQVARFLHERGDARLDWVLHDAVAGEIFAFGISEAGNEAVLMDSRSIAVPLGAGEGFRVSGTKVFTTLSPVWTRLGVHARIHCELEGVASEDEPGTHASDSDSEPQLVFGFVRREGVGTRAPAEASRGLAEGEISHPGTWNPLGMRATQSYTTELRGVRIAEADVAARMAPFDGTDPLILAIFSAFSILTAAVYAGIGDRALELAVSAANEVAVGPDGQEARRIDDPDIAARLTTAVLEHRASLDALELLARDVDEARARDDWFLALAAARNRVTDEARCAVEVAMRIVGARAFDADSELARLYRDVLAGLFHPSSSRALAKTARGFLRAE
ncbi:acyl-CoA dehydrogenase family protein [Leucobacter sp. W1478]|uniref:acyl-CoA dehydrogenase family protein n=1 Tax=Leucobacter sp. W1478 TaxID=3439065 RepID=UPI003F30EC02